MDQYPADLLNQMKPDDSIVDYLPLRSPKGGCLSNKMIDNGFIAITEQRLIFQQKSYGADKKSSNEQITNVPISKVSSMTLAHNTVKGGCLKGKEERYTLNVNVQGQMYILDAGLDGRTADAFVRTFLERSE